MKTILSLLAILILSMTVMAQKGINYKAVIKDGSGSILASQSVDIQFIIYEGAVLTNNVYQESHTTNTHGNGVIIVNIGEGTTADVFADVAWGNDQHWLNVQVNSGAGLVDMGTTQFMAVPYALNAIMTLCFKCYNDWVTTDPIFEIDNGSSTTSRSNAMTVLKNGNVGIEVSNPQAKLQILGGADAQLNGGGYTILGNQANKNLVIDDNEIMARNFGATAPLYLQQHGGAVYVGGVVVHASDERLKEDITDLHYGLNEILKLQPKSYYWKNREQSHKSFGLIAQELQPIIKELVLVQDDEEKTLSVNYTELIPVLINAIKEHQSIINIQNEKYNSLLDRVVALESSNNLNISKN